MSAADDLALRVAQAMLAREGTGPAWGLRILAAREGYAKVAMEIRDDMANGHKIVHGGMVFALADTAFAYASNSRNVVTVSQAASILFMAPAHVGETLVAEAQEETTGGRSGAYQVKVFTQGDGRVAAIFQGLSRSLGDAVIEPET